MKAFQEGDSLVAIYIRIIYDETSKARLCRVLVSRKQRSVGFGRACMRNVLKTIEIMQSKHETTSIMLRGQEHLDIWYEMFGFKVSGESILEDNIPHLMMLKRAQ